MAVLVAVAGAGDIVTGGLWSILEQAPDLEILRDFPHFGIRPDVVLYDVGAMQADHGAGLAQLITRHGHAVVVVGRDLRPDLSARALAGGAVACVSLEAPTYLVLSTIRAAAYGALGPDEGESEPLGAEAGLSPREVRVLGDIVRGFSNDEVAQRQGITLNTVKSNIRATYRKIGVTTRAQAVSWGLRNGFAFDDTWGGD